MKKKKRRLPKKLYDYLQDGKIDAFHKLFNQFLSFDARGKNIKKNILSQDMNAWLLRLISDWNVNSALVLIPYVNHQNVNKNIVFTGAIKTLCHNMHKFIGDSSGQINFSQDGQKKIRFLQALQSAGCDMHAHNDELLLASFNNRHSEIIEWIFENRTKPISFKKVVLCLASSAHAITIYPLSYQKDCQFLDIFKLLIRNIGCTDGKFCFPNGHNFNMLNLFDMDSLKDYRKIMSRKEISYDDFWHIFLTFLNHEAYSKNAFDYAYNRVGSSRYLRLYD